MNTSMVKQVRRRPKSFTAKLTLVVALASVNPTVNDQGIFAGERLAAELALVLTYARMKRSEMILEITPLAELAAAHLALVRPCPCVPIMMISIFLLGCHKTYLPVCTRMWTLRAPLAKKDLPHISHWCGRSPA